MIYCLIPVKPYAESKSRLAPLLSKSQRATLTRWLLRRTVRLARAAAPQVVVISRDRTLLAHARAEGARGLLEASTGLNLALAQGARFAQACQASSLLILPADLPRLSERDLKAILAFSSHSPAFVIAPCRHGTGTNALLMRPTDLIPFAFGPNSFAAHCAAAHAVGVEPAVYHADGFAFDLDTPQDWNLQPPEWRLEIFQSTGSPTG
jgi:2-phospho-L-lactate guanylyltransferase